MSFIINGILAVVLFFMVIFVVKVVTETVKLRRNSVPRIQNHDKRFLDIDNKYLHDMYDVKLR